MPKKKLLLFADWYEPGYKAGGPIRSCVNFVWSMQDVYDIYVFTSDRDLGAEEAYPGIRTDEWISGNAGAGIFYCSPGGLTWKNIRSQLRTLDPDIIVLESMFSARFTLYPLLMRRLYAGKGKIVLAPNGMLKDSAIRYKSFKKKFFLRLFRWFGFHHMVHFRATDETEKNDVQRYFGPHARVDLVPNFTLPPATGDTVKEKLPGQLTMITIGRLHPVKNLDYLLTGLRDVRARVRLTIIGSMEDRPYWEKCRRLIDTLPPNITVEYAGEIPYHELTTMTAGHHIFASPTRGENFGYAIFEALCLRKPVLISDQTPWRDLQPAKAGWDLPLDKPEGFSRAIEQAAAWDQREYDQWCAGAGQYVGAYLKAQHVKDKYLKLFN